MSNKRKPENIAFSINVTPDKKKKFEDDGKGYVAVLAPFNPFPKISFENIKLHTTSTREVYLVNPTENTLQIELTKLPDEARGYQWSATHLELPRESQVKLVISWTPAEYGSWHDNVKIVNKKTKKPLSELKLSSTTEEPPKVSKRNLRSRGVLTKKQNISSKQEVVKKPPVTKTKSENKENEVTYIGKCNKQTLKEPCIQNENVIIFETKKLSQNRTFTQIDISENDPVEKIHSETYKPGVQGKTVLTPQHFNIPQLGPSTPRRGTYEVIEPVSSSRRSTYSLRNKQISNLIDVENEKREFELLASPSIHNDSIEKAASKLFNQVKVEHVTYDENEEFQVGESDCIATTFTVQPSMTLNYLDAPSSLNIASSHQLQLYDQIADCKKEGKRSLESVASSEKFFDSLEERKSLELFGRKSGIEQAEVKTEDIFVNWDDVYDIDKFSEIYEKPHKNTYLETPQNNDYSNPVSKDMTRTKDSLIHLDEEFGRSNVSIVSSSPVSTLQKLSNNLNKTYTSAMVRSTLSTLNCVEALESYEQKFSNLDSNSFSNSNSSKNLNLGLNINGLEEFEHRHMKKQIVSSNFDLSRKNLPLNETESGFKQKTEHEEDTINSFSIGAVLPDNMDSNISTDLKTAAKWIISPPQFSHEKTDEKIKTENGPKLKISASFTPARCRPTRTKLSLPNSVSDTGDSYQLKDKRSLLIKSATSLSSDKNCKTDIKNPDSTSKEVFLVPSRKNKRSSLVQNMKASPPKIMKISQDLKIKRLSTPSSSRKLPVSSLTGDRKNNQSEKLRPLSRSAMSMRKRNSLKVADWVPTVRKLKLVSTSSQSEEDISTSPVDFTTPDPYLAATSLNPFAKGGLYFNNKWLKEQEVELIQWTDRMLKPPSELQLDRDQTEHSTLHRLNALRATAFNILTSTEVATVLSKVKIAVDRNIISIRSDRQLHADLGLQDKIISLLMNYNPLWLRLSLEVVYQCNIQLKCHSDQTGLRDFIRRYVLNDDYLRQKHSHPTIPYLMLPQFEDEMKKFTVYKFLVIVYLLDLVKRKKLILHDPCLFKKDSKLKSSKEILLDFNKDFVGNAGDITRILRLRGYEVSHCQTYIDEFDFSLSSITDLRDGVRLTRLAENLVSDNSLCSKLRVPAVSNLQKKYNAEVAFSALKKAGYDLPSDVIPKDISDGHMEKTLSFLWHLRSIFQKRAVLLIVTKWLETKQLRKDRKNFLKMRSSAIKIQRWYRNIKRANALSDEELKIGIETRERFVQLRAAAVCLQRIYRKKKEISDRKKKFKAATTIQRWYRNKKKVFKDRSNFIAAKKAATTIKRAFRNYKLKQLGSEHEERRNFLKIRAASVIIQRRFRLIKFGYQQRQEFLAIKAAAIKIQRRYRANKLARKIRNTFLIMRRSAITIQRIFRAFLISKKQRDDFKKKRAAAIVIQQQFRAYKCAKVLKQEYLKMKTATVFIQRKYRSYLVAKKQRKEFHVLKAAVVSVQRKFREKIETKRCREQFLSVIKATSVLQMRFRGYLLTKHQRDQFLKQKRAAIILQRRFRANKLMAYQKNQFFAIRAAAVVIQRKIRANKLAQIQRRSFLTLKAAVITLQRKFRSQLLMKCLKKESLARKSAAILIQRWYRASVLARHDRESFLALKSAVTTIQKKFRNQQLANQQRQVYIKTKSSAIVIQRKYRAYRLAKQQREEFVTLKRATITIQRTYRNLQIAKKQRQNYRLTKTTIIKVQRRFRANKEAKQKRNHFIKMRSAAVKIQRRFRAYIIAKRQRQEFIKLKTAVIVIQKNFKSKRLTENLRNEFLSMKAATLTIQRRFRSRCLAKQQRQDFLQMKTAANIIKNIYLSNKKAKLSRNQFLAVKSATITVQRRFRALMLAKRQRQYFGELKTSVVNIQRRFRLNKETKMLREHFIALKTATVKIQRKFRQLRLMRQQRQEFLTLKAAALFIQRKYRCHKLVKHQREEFMSIKLAAIKIQRRFRSLQLAKKERKHFLLTKSAAVKIQNIIRAKKESKLQRERFLKVKNAAVTIQRRYRLHLLAKTERNRFLAMKANAINIQRRYRSLKLAKSDRKNFLAIRNAAIIIQIRFRALLIAKRVRQEFLQIKSAALILQKKYNAVKQGKSQRDNFLAMRSATLTIQRRFRALLVMRHQRQEFVALKNATIALQRLFRARNLAKSHRHYFIMLKEATINIQRRFRERRMQRSLIDNSPVGAREYSAAIKIQALWRGYLVRKAITIPQPTQPKPSVADTSVDKSQTISTRGQRYLRFLSNHRKYSVAELQNTLFNIDKITVLSADQCEYFVKNGAVKILYDILEHQTNRAFGVDTCVELILSILLNLYRAPVTAEVVWKETKEVNGIFHVFDLMMRFKTEKTSTVFCKACTVIWLFAQDPTKAKVIMNTSKVQDTYKYIVKSMKKNDKLGSSSFKKSEQSRSSNKKSATACRKKLPALRFNWGNYFDDHRAFDDKLFALNAINDQLCRFLKL